MEKQCKKCGVVYPKAEGFFNTHSSTKDGFRHECKKCQREWSREYWKKNSQILNKRLRDWKNSNPERKHDYNLARFKLNHAEFESMLKEQGGCKICGTMERGRSGRNFSVDHCHKTNQVRGILCPTCNTGMGHFKDDPALLQKAANYLLNFNEVSRPTGVNYP
jgi:hypothetical protein